MSYHHYSPTPSGGLWATKEGTCDANESEAACTQIQRASSSSSVKSVLCPDQSTSSLVFNSRKCDTAATNVELEPQWTPLAAAASIRPLSSSAATDIDVAREDGPSALPSTKPQTQAVEVRRASSAASTSHHVASSTLSCPAASSR
jgi:hypothetical protein